MVRGSQLLLDWIHSSKISNKSNKETKIISFSVQCIAILHTLEGGRERRKVACASIVLNFVVWFKIFERQASKFSPYCKQWRPRYYELERKKDKAGLLFNQIQPMPSTLIIPVKHMHFVMESIQQIPTHYPKAIRTSPK